MIIKIDTKLIIYTAVAGIVAGITYYLFKKNNIALNLTKKDVFSIALVVSLILLLYFINKPKKDDDTDST